MTNTSKTPNDIFILLEKKIANFHDIIQKTILYVQKNKILDILGVSDLNNCINNLCDVSKKLKILGNQLTNDENGKKNNYENIIVELQNINNDLSSIFKTFGTDNIDDLLSVCFGNNNYINVITEIDKSYKRKRLR